MLQEHGCLLSHSSLLSNVKLNMPDKVLTEGGCVLLEHGGSFRSFISQAGKDARKMVELIVQKIPSYRDETTYQVSFH